MAVNHECKTSASPLTGEMRMLQEMNDKLIAQLRQSKRDEEDVPTSMRNTLIPPTPLKKPRLEQNNSDNTSIQSQKPTSPIISQAYTPTFVNPLDYSIHSRLADSNSNRVSPARKSGSSCNSHMGSFSSSSSSPSPSIPDPNAYMHCQQIPKRNCGWSKQTPTDNTDNLQRKTHGEGNKSDDRILNKRKSKQKKPNINCIPGDDPIRDGNNTDPNIALNFSQASSSPKQNLKRNTASTLGVNGNVRSTVSTAAYKYLTWREKDRRRRFREEWKHLWLVIPHGRYEVMCLVCHKVMTQRKLDTIKRHTVRRHVELLGMPEAERQVLFDQLLRQHNMLGVLDNANTDTAPQMKATARRLTGTSQQPVLNKSPGRTDEFVPHPPQSGNKLRNAEPLGWHPDENVSRSNDFTRNGDFTNIEKLKYTARKLLGKHPTDVKHEDQLKCPLYPTTWFSTEDIMRKSPNGSSKISSCSSVGRSDGHHMSLSDSNPKSTTPITAESWNVYTQAFSTMQSHSHIVKDAPIRKDVPAGIPTPHPVAPAFNLLFDKFSYTKNDICNVTRPNNNHSPHKSEYMKQSSPSHSSPYVQSLDTNRSFRTSLGSSPIDNGSNIRFRERTPYNLHNISPNSKNVAPLFDLSRTGTLPSNPNVYTMAAAAAAQSIMRLQSSGSFIDKPCLPYPPDWAKVLMESWSNIAHTNRISQSTDGRTEDSASRRDKTISSNTTGMGQISPSSVEYQLPNPPLFTVPPIPSLLPSYPSSKSDLDVHWSSNANDRNCNATLSISKPSSPRKPQELPKDHDVNGPLLNMGWNRLTTFGINSNYALNDMCSESSSTTQKDNPDKTRNRERENHSKMKECVHSLIFGSLIDASACPICICGSGFRGLDSFQTPPLFPHRMSLNNSAPALTNPVKSTDLTGPRPSLSEFYVSGTNQRKGVPQNCDLTPDFPPYNFLPNMIPPMRSIQNQSNNNRWSHSVHGRDNDIILHRNDVSQSKASTSVNEHSAPSIPTIMCSNLPDITVQEIDVKCTVSCSMPIPMPMTSHSDMQSGTILNTEHSRNPSSLMEPIDGDDQFEHTSNTLNHPKDNPENPQTNRSLMPLWELNLTPDPISTKVRKTGSDNIEAYQQQTSNCLRFHMLRLGPGQDLYECLSHCIIRKNLVGAFVVTCCGSLFNVRIRLANLKQEELKGPFEIVSLVGTIASDGHPHLHISLADSRGHVMGGHLLGPATIHTTAEIVLGAIGVEKGENDHPPDNQIHVRGQIENLDSENSPHLNEESERRSCSPAIRLVRKSDPITGFQELAIEKI